MILASARAEAGLSGMSTLSVGSFIALAAIIGGAVVALRWQAWRIERTG